jgi:hypothetical protein
VISSEHLPPTPSMPMDAARGVIDIAALIGDPSPAALGTIGARIVAAARLAAAMHMAEAARRTCQASPARTHSPAWRTRP